MKVGMAIKNIVYTHKKKIGAGLLFLFAVILGLSLYSFNPYDQSWFYYSSEKMGVTNLLGFLGSDLSALFFYLFGFSSFLFLFFLLYVSYFLFMNLLFRIEVERFIALFCLPFISAALLVSKQGDSFVMLGAMGPAGLVTPGGLVGKSILLFLSGWFDHIVLLVFLYALLAIALLCVFRATVAHLLVGAATVIRFVLNKQKFLIPAYTVTKKTMWVVSWPAIYAALFCKRLFCGEDVTAGYNRASEKKESILTFENYTIDELDRSEFDELYGSLDDENEREDFEYSSYDGSSILKELQEEPSQRGFDSSKLYRAKKPRILYKLPQVELFDYYQESSGDMMKMSELKAAAKILEEKLQMFGVSGGVVSIKRGPVITLFEYKPQADSKISKILALEDDLALALKALSIRIIAPIPGRSVVGFEVANSAREDVSLASIISSQAFEKYSGHIPLVLGKDTVGENIVVDLAKMPHLLIAGSTGSGKSVALNALLISMLYKFTPDQLNLILIDPKRLEFSAYEDISHLLFPIVTDPKKVSAVLKWVVSHMEERYEKMAKLGARNIFDYNKKVEHYMPFMVVVIDELADLMMTAGKDVEALIARIAQMARAAGIHMIVATQRPSVDVITGLIKVNFPSRISFRVTSKVDSRTILDCSGAEKLLGRGDMLFLGSGSSNLTRLHGAYISSKEIEKIVTHIRSERQVVYRDLSEYICHEETQLHDADDELYQEVLEFVDSIEEVSISLLQRKFRIGYNRSARIVEKLESDGLILPSDGGKMRKVVR